VIALDRAYRGDAQVETRDERISKARRSDEEHTASHKTYGRNPKKTDEPTNRSLTWVLDRSFKHGSPPAA